MAHYNCTLAWKSAGPNTHKSFAVICDWWGSGKVLDGLSGNSLPWQSYICNRHPVSKESANGITPYFLSYDYDYDVVIKITTFEKSYLWNLKFRVLLTSLPGDQTVATVAAATVSIQGKRSWKRMSHDSHSQVHCYPSNMVEFDM